jgi:hypothetical protein
LVFFTAAVVAVVAAVVAATPSSSTSPSFPPVACAKRRFFDPRGAADVVMFGVSDDV